MLIVHKKQAKAKYAQNSWETKKTGQSAVQYASYEKGITYNGLFSNFLFSVQTPVSRNLDHLPRRCHS